LGPTLIDHVPTTSKVYQEEIFGPVLSIVRVKTYEEGVALINSGAFGNGTAIFTNDGGAARKFVVDIEVGMVGVIVGGNPKSVSQDENDNLFLGSRGRIAACFASLVFCIRSELKNPRGFLFSSLN
jgi:acyl-CoA reductase-like NAD-dependent aldehyde dehydrogenase